MKIIMINGSPKVKDSNSEYLLFELKKLIEKDNEILEFNINKKTLNKEDFDVIHNSDAIVFGFPIYFDAVPSHLLKLLKDMEVYFKLKNQTCIKVYTITNCGFYEGSQNHLATEIVKNWCHKSNLTWGQGIGTGGGEMIGSLKNVPINHGPKKNLGSAINSLAENILKRSTDENIFISPNFPRFAFRICANTFWNTKAKANGLKKKDLFKN